MAKNLFLVPTGTAGREYVKLMDEWLEHSVKGTPFQGIALKVFFTLPNLMLQKPSLKSKTKDHIHVRNIYSLTDLCFGKYYTVSGVRFISDISPIMMT